MDGVPCLACRGFDESRASLEPKGTDPPPPRGFQPARSFLPALDPFPFFLNFTFPIRTFGGWKVKDFLSWWGPK